MLNSNKIRGRIVELGLSQDVVAKEMGIAQATFSQKISGKRRMSIDECHKLKCILHIEDADVCDYFFC